MKKQTGDGVATGFVAIVVFIVAILLSKTFRYILGGILTLIAIFVIVKIAKNKKAKKEAEEYAPPAQTIVEQNNNAHFEANNIGADYSRSKSRDRSEKGKSLMAFPDDYCVLDLETTGYDPTNDRIVEIGILKVRNNVIVDEFHSLVNPERKINKTTINVHGITDEMVKDSPKTIEILPQAREFMANDIIVAHNAHFDVNFMYDQSLINLSKPFTNDFVDTLRVSKKLFPELEHHKMSDIVEKLNIEQEDAHRAIADCYTLFRCFTEMKKIAPNISVKSTPKDEKRKKNNIPKEKTDLREIVADNTSFDENHPLFGKHCVFTGTLEKMSRVQAAQKVVNIGGFCDNGVTKKTNYLIVANEATEKSSKQKKAEEIKSNGGNIEIVSENVFYEMIETQSATM